MTIKLRHRASVVVVFIVLGALVAAACSSGGKSKAASTTTAAPQSSTVPPNTAPPESSTTSAAEPPPVTAAPDACAPSQIDVTLANEEGAGGTGLYDFDITNTSTATCQLGGYFGVSIYDQPGHVLSGASDRVDDPIDNRGSEPVPLPPGTSAHFRIAVVENPPGNAVCPVIGAFHLIPPNQTAFVQVSTPAAAGHFYCQGTPTVSPTRPGPVSS